MKKIVVWLWLIGFISCQEKEITTIFSGTIKGTDAQEIELEGINFSKKIPLQANGTFSDTLDLPYDGMYYLVLTDEKSFYVYLEKGFQLQLETYADDFINSMKYSGLGQDENKYLIEKNKLIESKYGDQSNFENVLKIYTDEEQVFLENIENLKKSMLDKLAASQIKNEKFIKNEKKEIEILALKYQEQYAPYHGYAINNREFKTSATFPKAGDDYTMNDEETFKHSYSYRTLIGGIFQRIMYGTPSEEKTPFDKGMEKLNTISSPIIRSELIKNMAYEMNLTAKNLDVIYNGLMKHSIDTAFNKETTQKYETLKKLVKGSPSPTFNYENIKGGKTSLESLKGKFVYIDVWATWCGPCIGEIPALKAIEKEYHGKNIEFVSISIDAQKDQEKWKKMVAEKELKGIQLFADNDWKSDFVKNYAIDGIPRFILIDTEGKIVNADAPRPSEEKLKELLKEVGL
ncbi:TlpA family protein disulfide reductase [Flavobacterium sp.]|uniref:TlpA family protein disulfide reductase n=1 Tax=Flavobacterium sp. TaxID=239 RepID=UPI002FD91FAA